MAACMGRDVRRCCLSRYFLTRPSFDDSVQRVELYIALSLSLSVCLSPSTNSRATILVRRRRLAAEVRGSESGRGRVQHH